jgi:8-oxo-dGTP pyrophosphatase MutT (NUDIX family)
MLKHEELRTENARFTAPPDSAPPHSTCGTVDLVLLKDGEPADMGWGFNQPAGPVGLDVMTLVRLALAVLHDAHGRVLVQLREPDKPGGGMWGLVGGHIEPGEMPEDAARREVREETGFAVADLTPFGHVIDGGAERFVYHARADGEVVPGEGVAYEWLSTLDDRPFVPQDAAVLGEFLARRPSRS